MLKRIGMVMLTSSLILTACSNDQEDTQTSSQNAQNTTQDKQTSKEGEHHMGHHHGQMPEHMHHARHSQFDVGDDVRLKEGHMPGMMNADGKVKGAYNTCVYEVSYQPTDGGKKVSHHKWVVNEEIENAPKEGFKKGDTVTLKANHMKGMKGAKATIDKVEKTTVYTVDYKDKDNGKMIKNHMWMTEDELSPR
ncbi:YdhK family protein [Staphylococcus simulans]|uniref:YdhK family protein n=1 Tax=Staphylococcus simulans TaxID=1286 RepID=UPI0021CFE3F0|nr:YdhK family protein [Staphylococcus simulans]UXR48016.1 YdhK family protein [Staphylococcus simulans]